MDGRGNHSKFFFLPPCLSLSKINTFKKNKKYFIYFIFREREREGEREGEKHQCAVASRTPPAGHLARNPACAMTGNQTGGPLVLRLALNPLSHTSQGKTIFFFKERNHVLRRACWAQFQSHSQRIALWASVSSSDKNRAPHRVAGG